jgi:hypothetical protein
VLCCCCCRCTARLSKVSTAVLSSACFDHFHVLLLLLLLLLQVYREAVASERCSVVHLTRVEADPPCDTHFPDITAEGEHRAVSRSLSVGICVCWGSLLCSICSSAVARM